MKNDQYHEKLPVGNFPSCIYDDTSDMDIDKIFWSKDDCVISTLWCCLDQAPNIFFAFEEVTSATSSILIPFISAIFSAT